MTEREYEGITDGKLNEFEVRDELASRRKNIKTLEELTEFIKDVEENYNYDYGVAPRSIAQAILAIGDYLASKMGITGFQASCVLWDFIMDWQYPYNKCGLKIINYDDMLYPQYDHKFDKTISDSVWTALQEQAKQELEKAGYAHPSVVAHWQSIADGNVPFGYTVKNH